VAIEPTSEPVPVAAAQAELIRARLAELAAARRVRILYAAESGSRAWGFASADSDFDVRFIYCHEAAWYLSLVERRDVIERPLDADLLDIGGWDLRKALRLLLKSNPPLHEWLISPIVYADNDGCGAALRELFRRYAVPRRLMLHYLSMARGQRDLLGPRDLVRRKRYLYVVRPLLAVALLAQGVWPPPMSIGPLLDAAHLANPVREAIDALVAEKRAGGELGEGTRIPVLDRWVAEALAGADPEPVGGTAEQDDAGVAAQRFFLARIGLDALIGRI
jgi:predicted nucleotidyltransferase